MADATDETRPGKRRLRRWMVGGQLFIVIAIAVALLVLPVRSWLRQKDQIEELDRRSADLHTSNEILEAQIARLGTDDGIREAARTELGYQQPGEQTVSVLPNVGPATLPPGWPFDLVTNILTVRAGAAMAAAAAPPTVPPDAPSTVPAPTTVAP